MKTLNHFFLIALLSLGVLTFTACEEPADEPEPQPMPQPDPVESVCTDGIKNAILTTNPDTLCSNVFENGLTLNNDPDKDVDFIINNIVYVDGGALSIEPGTVIEFNTNAGFFMRDNGIISALGTAADPIIMRGFNVNGTRWRGIHLQSVGVEHKMHYCEVRNAGGNNLLGAIYMQFNSQLELQNSSIINSDGHGLATDGDGASLPNFSNNTISGSANYPVSVRDGDAAADLDDASTYTGNGTDRIWVGEEPGGVGFNSGISELGSSFNVTSVAYELGKGLILGENSSLTLDAGVTILIASTNFMNVRPGAVLTANGTSTNAVAIDQAPNRGGKWGYIENFGTINFANAVVTNGGNSTGANPAMIYNHGSGRLDISNSTISNSATVAISVSALEHITESGNTYTNNANGDVVVR